MEPTQLNWITNFIWGIADDVLESTKPAVLALKATLDRQAAADKIVSAVSQATQPGTVQRLSNAPVLWVDDRPANNVYERRALEALGIRFTISNSTEDAVERLRLGRYDAIVSDMGCPPDARAGHTLLDAIRSQSMNVPFIIYAGSSEPEHKEEARRHGALGSTNDPGELFQLLTSALRPK